MKPDELKLIQQMIEISGGIGELKGEIESLKKENEFLRGLLAERLKELELARSAIESNESAQSKAAAD